MFIIINPVINPASGAVKLPDYKEVVLTNSSQILFQHRLISFLSDIVDAWKYLYIFIFLTCWNKQEISNRDHYL